MASDERLDLADKRGARAGAEKLDQDPSSLKGADLKISRGSSKAKVISRISDRVEDYALVTRGDLEAAVELGGLQQILTQVGTFLFSGAFWLLIELVVRESEKPQGFVFTAWMGMCLLSVFAGGSVSYAGWRLFRLKQANLKKYFP
jgi:hypothetical protein